MALRNSTAVRQGIRIEVATVVYMVFEAALAIGAGIAARSVLLAAFGIDSLLELASGGVLLWRLQVESTGGDLQRVERAERQAARWTVVLLALLCVYILAASIYGLITRAAPESSPVGIAVSLAAVLFMPYLAWRKRKIAGQIGSLALEDDATASITCAYMAGTVLAGLVLNALLQWWWVEDAAALVFLIWLVRETVEAYEEASE